MTFPASVVEFVVTVVVVVKFGAGGGVVLQDKVNKGQISNKSPINRMIKALDIKNSVSCFKVLYFILPDTDGARYTASQIPSP